jgi:hypothetical protein
MNRIREWALKNPRWFSAGWFFAFRFLSAAGGSHALPPLICSAAAAGILGYLFGGRIIDSRNPSLGRALGIGVGLQLLTTLVGVSIAGRSNPSLFYVLALAGLPGHVFLGIIAGGGLFLVAGHGQRSRAAVAVVGALLALTLLALLSLYMLRMPAGAPAFDEKVTPVGGSFNAVLAVMAEDDLVSIVGWDGPNFTSRSYRLYGVRMPKRGAGDPPAGPALASTTDDHPFKVVVRKRGWITDIPEVEVYSLGGKNINDILAHAGPLRNDRDVEAALGLR